MNKIEIRGNCKICGQNLTLRFRTFCSTRCRNKNYAQKYSIYRKQWQQNQRGKYSRDKLKCGICGKWYTQVCSHVFQIHGMTGRAYREHLNLPVKRGVTPAFYRKLKGDMALANKTSENLQKGAKFRFLKGDTRAKTNTFWKSHRYIPDELYN